MKLPPSTLFICLSLPNPLWAAPAPVSWNFDVRPILAAKCFSCHGSDGNHRKAGLRLDEPAGLKEGILIPGKPAESELIKRIHQSDPDEVMPPPEKSPPLSLPERQILERWVAEGAHTEKHWAFLPPVKPDLHAAPAGLSPIDYLIEKKWAEKNLHPAPPANKTDWLRRVSFALTGLPPVPEETAALLAAPDEEAAYAAAVDRLLASPHFGERLAQDWLDAARYGDTYGRHEDADSETWPWRDWVIQAFNHNLSYDKFITEQIAGDLLPAPTQDQRIATAFNRLCVQSNESGSNPEEFRWAQVFDRVKTNATVFMGLTLECAQCHDHKFDPLSQKEYYQFASFFNNIDELGLFSRFSNGTPSPTTIVYKDGEAGTHTRLKEAIQTAEAARRTAEAGAAERYDTWLKTNLPPGQGPGLWSAVLADPTAHRSALPRAPQHYFSFDLIDAKAKKFLPDAGDSKGSTDNANLSPPPGRFGFGAGLPRDKDKKYEFPGVGTFSRTDAFSFTLWVKSEADLPRAVIAHRSRAGLDAANRGYELTIEQGHLTATLAHFYPGNAIRVECVETVDLKDWHHLGMTYDGSSRASGLAVYFDGKPMATRVVRDGLTRDIGYLKEWGDVDNDKVADARDAQMISFEVGGRNLDKSLRGSIVDDLKIYDCALSPAEIALASGFPVPDESNVWLAWYQREIDEPCRAAAAALHEARVAENTFSIHLRDHMVMAELPGPRRPTPILKRGNYDTPGDPVSPGIPASLSPWPAKAPANRLGLAQWLTAPEHPLTARVEVNRLWRLFFGHGIVSTGQDFGIQGSPPSHPALLDWLAVHFRESGWDLKKLCRDIALSRTFRQSSTPADPADLSTDPENRWLARGPRLRLPAEQIRDAALAVSGLLVPTVGGPSVKPWQPPGLWEDSGTQHTYEMDRGDALHRRSLYTFWRRTCPPPLLAAFDAPSREFCLVQREESLTPLQTLAVLNDNSFLEAAAALATRVAASGPAEPVTLIQRSFELATGRLPTPVQATALLQLLTGSLAYYQANPAEAITLLQTANAKVPPTPAAGLMVVCRALFSSEEFLRSW